MMKLFLRRISYYFTEEFHKHVFEGDNYLYLVTSKDALELHKTYDIDLSKALDLSEECENFPKGHYFHIDKIKSIATEIKVVE